MRTSHGVTIALAAAAALTFAPAAEALPPIRVHVPHIELPTTSLRPLTESEWTTGARAYETRLNEAGDVATLSAEETLRQIRTKELLDEVDKCALAAGLSVIEGTAQTYVDDGQFSDVTDVVSAMISGCLGEHLPEWTPEEGTDAVSDAIAEQVVDAVGGADPSSTAPIDVAIDWAAVPHESGTGDTTDTSYTSDLSDSSDTSDTSDDGGGSSPIPAIVGVAGIGLLILVVRTIKRRT